MGNYKLCEGRLKGRKDREREAQSGKGLVKEQEDRTGYVLPFETTESEISESIIGGL